MTATGVRDRRPGTAAPGPAARAAGRPRDQRATTAILAATRRQLEDVGFGRLSLESVAAEAGVSRTTVYRRFEGKGDLVTAAIADVAPDLPAVPSADPRGDLVRLLGDFEERFGEDCLEVLGGLLGLREEPEAMALHRHRVVWPRTAPVRALLEQAVAGGALPPGTEVDRMVEMLAGAVLARRAMGVPPDRRWAEDAVATFWPPEAGRTRR